MEEESDLLRQGEVERERTHLRRGGGIKKDQILRVYSGLGGADGGGGALSDDGRSPTGISPRGGSLRAALSASGIAVGRGGGDRLQWEESGTAGYKGHIADGIKPGGVCWCLSEENERRPGVKG